MINVIEKYLDELVEIKSDIYNTEFEYGDSTNDSYDTLKEFYLEFMLNNLYQDKLTTTKKHRLNQREFREELLKKYKGCIVTGETCEVELTAAHIVPVSENDNYDIDNGLLLSENLHRTFDHYLWSINPKTMTIETKSGKNAGHIEKYKNHKINLEPTTTLYKNLSKHHSNFLKN